MRQTSEPRSTVRTSDTGSIPRIEGYAAIFFDDGDPGSEYQLWSYADEVCKERIAPGAFDRCLRERQNVLALYNHDRNIVLGRTSAGTLSLRSDKTGLFYQIDVPDTNMGRDLVESIRRRDITGSSFSFSPGKQTWSESKMADGRTLVVRQMDEFELVDDIGPVSRPAYEATTASVVNVAARCAPSYALASRLAAGRARNDSLSLRSNRYMYEQATLEHAAGQRNTDRIVDASLDDITLRRKLLAERRTRIPSIADPIARRMAELDADQADDELKQLEENGRVLDGVRRRREARRQARERR